MTIAELQLHIADQLQTVSDAPELDSQRIILHALEKRDTSFLIAHSEDTLTEEQQHSIQAMAGNRLTGMPLAYIIGEADFYGRTFTVTPDVLIPRPDTEALIEQTLEYIKNNFRDTAEVVIADICTGSGIIAITLALELPQVQIIATDISPAALAVARQNGEQHGVLGRIKYIQGDLLEPFDAAQGKPIKIDLIVSNPPYVPTSVLAKAADSIETRGLTFEPNIALDGGKDGLKFVDQIKHYAQENNIPAIIETVGGEIETVNI